MDKHTLSLKSINTILDAIEPEKNLLYDKDYIETLYRRYQSTECNDEADIQALSASWSDRPLLLLGPGKNLELEKEAILSYIKGAQSDHNLRQFYPGGNSNRLCVLKQFQAVCPAQQPPARARRRPGTPGARHRDLERDECQKIHFDYTLNYNSLIDQNAEIIDNSFVMLLNVLTKTSVHHAACAGFDGYTVDGDNYYNSAMDYRIAREKSQSINQYVIDTLERLAGTLTLEFLTDSKYVK